MEYAYGSSVLNRDGGRADTLRRFTSRAERDTWVAQGEPFDGPGERAALTVREMRRWYGTPDERYWESEL